MTKPEGFFGWQGVTSDTSEYNRIRFLIKQELRDIRTGVPVKIVAVHGGGVGAAPTVDVQPIIPQVDGVGTQTPHGIIHGIPVSRNQGGGNAVINDPVVGDVGHMVISDRDTSALRANKGQTSLPGSRRTHDMADGVYHGAMLNPANPTQAVQFTATGVTVFDKNGNTMVMSPAGTKMSDANGNTMEMKSGQMSVSPGGGTLFLGGNGSDGSYALVQTLSGPSTNVKAKI